MKKIFCFSVAVTFILASGCTEEPVPVSSGTADAGAFTLKVNIPDTRTVFDGETYAVDWEPDDVLGVYIVSGESGTLYRFEKATGENVFSCQDFTPEEGVDYTYYVLYPYDSDFAVTDGKSTDVVNIISGTQSASGSSAHIETPLYGSATATGTVAPEISLKHLVSVVKVTVNNFGTTSMNISEVALVSSDLALSGTYSVDFSTGELTAGTVYPTASVSVADGSLAASATGTYFLVCAPISSASFTVSVNSGELTAEKSGVTFDAGKVYSTGLDELTEITVTPDRTRILLTNPLSGWVTYSGIGSGLADNYWELYDDFDCADAPDGTGKVSVWDYSNVLYIKADWSAMNPEDGVYIWEQDPSYSDFAYRLHYLMDGAEERGLKIAFTINTNSEDDHTSSTPDFVREEDPESCYATTTGSATVYSGYPDNPTFQKYYEKFVKAFAARFNDPDEVAFISGLGLGKWGECHTFRYSTENTIGKGDESPRYVVYDWVTSLYADNFTRVPVVTNYHKMVGRTTGSGTADAMSSELLNLAISKGFCMRHDAFGMKSYYGDWERNFIAGHKYDVPVIGEGGWVQSSHNYSGDYSSERELREGEYDAMSEACVNMMDLRYNSNTSSSETYSWFNTAFDLVEQFLQEGVYRLYPNTLWLPESVNTGEAVTVRSNWSNLGNAYFPADLKQWNGRYKMAYALLDKDTGEARYIFVDTGAALQKVLKDAGQTFDTEIDLSGVSSGNYTWGIAIVNTEKNNVPDILLSVSESSLTDSGWLKLSDVTVDARHFDVPDMEDGGEI